MKKKLSRTVVIFTAVLLCSGGLVAYAATSLFTQSIPGQTFETASIVAGSCGGSLVLNTGNSTLPTHAGNAATLVYACSSTGAAAFSNPTTSNANVTPTFVTPSGWTLRIFNEKASTCMGTLSEALTSGAWVLIGPGVLINYCLTSNSASNFTSISITWSA